MSIKIENIDDIELFKMLSKNEKEAKNAFSVLYSRHSSKVYAYCRRYLGTKELAQDVFQEIFVRFYQTGLQKRTMTNVPAFLMKITRNLCHNARRISKKVIIFEDYMATYQDDRKEEDELLKMVKMAMELLPDEYKDLFILREYNGFSYLEICEVTGLPITTVKIRLHRAKEKIREVLAPYLNENLNDKKKANDENILNKIHD